ncbi:uncharacterized protein LOC106138078 isoform X9 [Amyelois transitella]|uniref:uncharacterized protein LOC106138078 isoform X9 n=1 Tax=Amyelois transitella TaxID=680683 RepID=UPI0029902169|nr:uncharacterized protein LOC106138078 isoform X9 [Amyelois transitella]
MEYRTAICRLCLVTDEHMFAIGGTPLQIVYEKLTNIQFLDEAKPVVACQICHAQLKKSWKLMVTSLKADNVFTDYLKNNTMIDVKSFSLLDRRAYNLGYPMVTTLVEITDRPPEEFKLEVKKESELTSLLVPDFPGLNESVVLIESKTDVNAPNVELDFMKEEVEWLSETGPDAAKLDSDSEDDIPVTRLKRTTTKRSQTKRTTSKKSSTKRTNKRTPAKRQPKAVTFIEPPKEDEDMKETENKEEPDDISHHQEDNDDDSDYEPPPVKEDSDEEPEKPAETKQRKRVPEE